MRTVLFALLATTVFSTAVPALAGATQTTYVTENDHDGNNTFAAGGPTGTVGDSSFASIAGGPTLTAHAASTAAVGSAFATATTLYHFTISLGGPPSSFIDTPGYSHNEFASLTVTYAGSANITGDGQAVSSLTIRDLGGSAFDASLNCSSDGGSCGSIGGTSAFDFLYYSYGGGTTAGQLELTGEIEMLVIAQGNDFGNGFTADAWLDPTISFGADFAAAHPGASITIEPLSPTPEPGVWAMMASGLALVGVAARRRRKRG